MFGSLKEEVYLDKIKNVIKDVESISTKEELENFKVRVNELLNKERYTVEIPIDGIMKRYVEAKDEHEALEIAVEQCNLENIIEWNVLRNKITVMKKGE